MILAAAVRHAHRRGISTKYQRKIMPAGTSTSALALDLRGRGWLVALLSGGGKLATGGSPPRNASQTTAAGSNQQPPVPPVVPVNLPASGSIAIASGDPSAGAAGDGRPCRDVNKWCGAPLSLAAGNSSRQHGGNLSISSGAGKESGNATTLTGGGATSRSGRLAISTDSSSGNSGSVCLPPGERQLRWRWHCVVCRTCHLRQRS